LHIPPSARGNPAPDSLFVFIDESGNFDFSNNGTNHFVMTCVAALSPLDSAASLDGLKYQLLAEGFDISCFHASEDRQFIRDRVFPLIDGLKNIKAHAIYGDKHRAAPSLQSPEGLYALFGSAIIKFAVRAYAADNYKQIIVIFDQALTNKQQGFFMGAVKPELKKLGKPFHIYFQRLISDGNGQIADYICWAKYVVLERNELRPWTALQNSLRPTDFNIFRNGHTQYY
jgi:hypothetical protein